MLSILDCFGKTGFWGTGFLGNSCSSIDSISLSVLGFGLSGNPYRTFSPRSRDWISARSSSRRRSPSVSFIELPPPACSRAIIRCKRESCSCSKEAMRRWISLILLKLLENETKLMQHFFWWKRTKLVRTHECDASLSRTCRPGGYRIEKLFLYFIWTTPFKKIAFFNRTHSTTKHFRYIVLVIILYIFFLFRNEI